jgi:CPA2 family monovalent cation:H+ antiporter-2
VIDLIDPDRVFALGHVPARHRAAVAAVWALDEQLGLIIASIHERRDEFRRSFNRPEALGGRLRRFRRTGT